MRPENQATKENKMTTKEKIRMICLEREERQLTGCSNMIGDGGRQLKAEVYADVLRRHPKQSRLWLDCGRFGRVVRAVNNLITA